MPPSDNTQYECLVLTQDESRAMWAELRGLLTKAVEHCKGELEVDDILDLVSKGRMFVAVLRERGKAILAIAVEVVPYPRMSVMNVVAMGGTWPVDARGGSYPFFEQIAQALKVDRIRCYCRESMARYLARYTPGFERVYVVMEKGVHT